MTFFCSGVVTVIGNTVEVVFDSEFPIQYLQFPGGRVEIPRHEMPDELYVGDHVRLAFQAQKNCSKLLGVAIDEL